MEQWLINKSKETRFRCRSSLPKWKFGGDMDGRKSGRRITSYSPHFLNYGAVDIVQLTIYLENIIFKRIFVYYLGCKRRNKKSIP